MGVNSLPKTVTRQRSGCDLNPGPSAPESSTLTTRLPSHSKLGMRHPYFPRKIKTALCEGTARRRNIRQPDGFRTASNVYKVCVYTIGYG